MDPADYRESCKVCGLSEHTLRCARCKLVYYCSREHQEKDWRNHRKFCRKHRVDKGKTFDKNKSADGIDSKDEKSDSVMLVKVNSEADAEIDAEFEKRLVMENGTGEELYVNDNPRACDEREGAVGGNVSPITFEGSSEAEILNASTENLNPSYDYNTLSDSSVSNSDMPPQEVQCVAAPADAESQSSSNNDALPTEVGTQALLHREICNNVVRDMDSYGVCVVDGFLGHKGGMAVLDEVKRLYNRGDFRDGQLVSNRATNDLKRIRGDLITWIDGKESDCKNIGQLISCVDSIIVRANNMRDNGKMGRYNISGRTKAMVACYPGSGSHYVKHVDNPNKDGRCITAIYYLNVDWDVEVDGGLLRIFPEGWRDQVANIEPLFDRLLFFWSDRRNPHEVQPAHRTRYAITLWYYDGVEREEACRRYNMDGKEKEENGGEGSGEKTKKKMKRKTEGKAEEKSDKPTL